MELDAGLMLMFMLAVELCGKVGEGLPLAEKWVWVIGVGVGFVEVGTGAGGVVRAISAFNCAKFLRSSLICTHQSKG